PEAVAWIMGAEGQAADGLTDDKPVAPPVLLGGARSGPRPAGPRTPGPQRGLPLSRSRPPAPGRGRRGPPADPRIDLPPVSGSHRMTMPPSKDRHGIAGLRILVAEDEMLVAMMLEDMLDDLGCTVVGPANRVPQAL